MKALFQNYWNFEVQPLLFHLAFLTFIVVRVFGFWKIYSVFKRNKQFCRLIFLKKSNGAILWYKQRNWEHICLAHMLLSFPEYFDVKWILVVTHTQSFSLVFLFLHYHFPLFFLFSKWLLCLLAKSIKTQTLLIFRLL
jgi:hypothetical protein